MTWWMVAAHKRKSIGTEEVPTVMDPPRLGGFRVVSDAEKIKPLIASIVVERAI